MTGSPPSGSPIGMRGGGATHVPAPDADCPAGGGADVPAEAESSTGTSLTDGGLTDGTPTIWTPAPVIPAPVMDGAPLPAAAIFAQAHAPNGSPSGWGRAEDAPGSTPGDHSISGGDQVRRGPYPMGRWQGPLGPIGMMGGRQCLRRRLSCMRRTSVAPDQWA